MIAFEAHQSKTIRPPKLPSTLDGVSKNDAVLRAPQPRRDPGKYRAYLSPTKQWSRLSSRWGVYSLSGSDSYYLISVPHCRMHSSQPRDPRSSDERPSFIAVAFVQLIAGPPKMVRTPGRIRSDPFVRPRFKLAGYAGISIKPTKRSNSPCAPTRGNLPEVNP